MYIAGRTVQSSAYRPLTVEFFIVLAQFVSNKYIVWNLLMVKSLILPNVSAPEAASFVNTKIYACSVN
jgi:hypothetical protein